MGAAPSSVFLFDGDCGFCRRSVEWLERGRPHDVAFRPWQAENDLHGLGPRDLELAAYLWDARTNRLHRGHRAFRVVLARSAPARRALGRVMYLPPVSVLCQAIYWFVSRNRARVSRWVFRR